jgi:fucose 4-O-acetylase-like acetyltransferase
MKTRIWFLDNLRTFLIFLVVLLHAGMCYESGFDSFWIVSDPAKVNQVAWVRTYLDLFVMFLMFFISGYFIPVSLKGKNTMEFIKSKIKRIMIPWIIAVFTLIPAYKAIFLFSRGLPQEEWFSYFHLFRRTGSDLSFVANNPNQNWLWFLPVLFLFQILYLALSKFNLLSVKISLKTGVLLTFTIGLIYSLIISLSGYTGWAHSPLLDFQVERLLVYFMVFLLGSLCYKLNVFESTMRNRKRLALVSVALLVSLTIFTVIAWNLFLNLIDPLRNHFYFSEVTDRLIYYAASLLSMLGFVYILIDIFRFSFNKSYRIMDQLNKNSYQVYIIHMIILGIIALILVRIPVPALIKYFILTVLTYIVSNVIVYAYKKTFPGTISMKTAMAVITAAVLLSVVVYIKQADLNRVHKQTNVSLPASLMDIHKAAMEGNIEAIRQHIKAGSDLDIKEPSGGSSPLITAITFGRTEVALALIVAGADVNFINNAGSTPLHTAAFFCRPEIVKALLEKGADKNIRNKAGSTAFESVTVPYDAVRGIYDYFGKAYGPLGLELDTVYIKTTRQVIAAMLR